jgi:hypothetical protein
LSSSTEVWGLNALRNEEPSSYAIDDIKQRQNVFADRVRKCKFSNHASTSTPILAENGTGNGHKELTPPEYFDPNVYGEISPLQRLIDDLLDTTYYEKIVHPKINFSEPTRVDLRMSLYQILEVVSIIITITSFRSIMFRMKGHKVLS